ncbi:xanthine dehydrogenase family protein subunit M [Skermanella sp. TT6]|uniref:Xanthine dehydrogenase family protein subunit M n=1 Tax=Skermanella cutis TaxID=2775420 RepID=A0ABX7B2B4_9PROT|nr:xanthine dehydrogenase family protein subunit M [Skermanella sp. TT6]QQP88464.1 xanthine dehydrogenase family protein subunit M [Skermanella sp. TT6]
MYAFEYHRPTTLADAARLASGNEDAKILAGGQTLIPTLKQRLAQPSDVVDLGAVAELRGIREEGDTLVIGATTPHAEVAASAVVQRLIPALAKLAEGIGDAQVRNRGTLGGSICNNDPSADYPAALVGLGATVRTTTRTLAAEDFFTGMFETALEPNEIVTAVAFPKPGKAAYVKFPNPASRYATVGVFVAETGGSVRVAVTGAAPSVYRWTEAEQALAGGLDPAALDALTVDADGLNADIHASAEYRASLVKVMAKRAVAACG